MRALLNKNRPEPDTAEVKSGRANDTQNEASFLQTLAHSLDDSEDTSEAIGGELAEIANKRWGKKLGPDKLKEKLGKYKRPANCITLTPIRINNEIWSRLKTRKKTADLKVGNIQQCILKVVYANLQKASKLLQLKKPCLNPMIESAVESVADLGHASHELVIISQEQIRPALKQEFAALCSREIPQCGEIFGKDLPKQLRDAEETSKMNEAFYSNFAYTSSYTYNKAKYKIYQYNRNTNKGDKKQRQTGLAQEEKIQPTTRTKVLEQLEANKTSVSEFPAFVPTLNKYLSGKCNTFAAGRVAQFLPKWKQITNIISDISGVKTEFDTPPVQHNFKQTKFAPEEEAITRSEISSLLAKQVIELAEHESEEIISNIFLRPERMAAIESY